MPYLILYYNVSLKMDNYVLIMAPAVIVAAIVTAFYGRVYDRFHFKVAVMPAIGTLMLGYVLLYLFKTTALVFVGSLFMMSGYLMGMAVFGAMLRDYTPQNRAGMFQGLRIVGQVLIPGIVGPWIGAMVLRNAEQVLNDDGTHSFIPNANIFLAAFLAACFIWIILGVIFKLTKKAKED
jgi:MFS family permease